ncbi:MAG: type II toxin-antitoxin system VapC family toxin [Planctomycetota bacterium]
MKEYVVDASVAAKWFFDEPHAVVARRLLSDSFSLHAPDFFLLEMDNLFCKRIRRGEITVKDGNDARAILRAGPIQFYPITPVRDMAYRIAIQSRRSIYDCIYVALAVLLNATMVTADRRLYEAISAGPLGGYAAWVADIRNT